MRMLLVGLAGAALLTGGCVSTRGYDDALGLLENERTLNNSLKQELLARDSQLSELEKANKDWQSAYNRAIELASQPVTTQVVIEEVPIDNALDEVRNVIGRELTSLEGDWNVIRAAHAVGVRLDDGAEVLFMPGSWKLTDKATKSLTKLATALKDTLTRHPDYIARIDGHTDSDPVRAAKKVGINDNTHLAFMRADAVRQFMVAQGVDEKRLFVAAMGEHMPVSGDKKLNRRVDVWVSTPEGFSLNSARPKAAPTVRK